MIENGNVNGLTIEELHNAAYYIEMKIRNTKNWKRMRKLKKIKNRIIKKMQEF